ncbi:MAG TPA: PEP-CTERM sorting domain-containing protein [Bryobacteraceae bacterium]|nr:PEP-CTERM sorting domain-containing protein [Bryobacteraceae bacterium]
MKASLIAFFAWIAVASLALVTPARAALMLNAAGTSDGFTLTTFVSGYNAEYGPLAQGIAPNGNVITGSLLNTKIYVFSDVDGQTLASAVGSTSYTCTTSNCNFAMATAGGQVYGAQAQGGVYEHFANDGSFTPIPNLQAAGLLDNLGMWGDPINGHIIASSNRGLVEIDPVAGTFRVINASLFPDGVSVSADGTIAYVENGGTVQSYNIATGALLHTYSTGHSPDGTGVISGGSFNGDVIVNDNDGTVGLLDPVIGTFTIIATGGTRGDFVSPDLNNGTLFLSQEDQVARLSCGPGCSIGGPPPGVPEPATFGLLGAGLAALGLIQRRKTTGLRP